MHTDFFKWCLYEPMFTQHMIYTIVHDHINTIDYIFLLAV